MATFLTEDVASYTATTAGPYRLGEEYVDASGRTFRLLQLTDDVTAKNGWVAEWASVTSIGLVTVKRTSGSSLGRNPACVVMGTVTPAIPFFFGLTRGIHPAVKNGSGGNIGALNRVVPNTSDGGVTVAGALENAIGITRTASGANGLPNPVDVDL